MMIRYRVISSEKMFDTADFTDKDAEYYQLTNGSKAYVVAVWGLADCLNTAHDDQHRRDMKRQLLRRIYEDIIDGDGLECCFAFDASFFDVAETALFI